MGITANCAKFLFYAKQNNVSFEKTLMLGRQHLYASSKIISAYSKKYLGIADSIVEGPYSEQLFYLLGARSVDSIDYSNYEQATIQHDLNFPVPKNLHNAYSFIFDGGTLEHIFNIPIALHNLMAMLKVGGHIVSITPANNQCGHGFYQFSPELFFSAFSTANGFRVNSLFVAPDTNDEKDRSWYIVKNPAEAGGRVTLTNDRPTYIMLLAEKITPEIPETITAFQSDYVQAWSANTKRQSQRNSSLKNFYRSFFSPKIRDWIYSVLIRKKELNNIAELGVGNSNHFEKVNF
jgi:hypothetical protein